MYKPTIGAIFRTEIIDETGRTYVIWEGTAQAAPQESRIFSIDNIKVDLPARRVRLVLRTDKVPGFNEIDAVCLIGSRTMVRETRTLDPAQQLAAIILRFGRSVERGREEKLADSAFLRAGRYTEELCKSAYKENFLTARPRTRVYWPGGSVRPILTL